jgi:YggT family protein
MSGLSDLFILLANVINIGLTIYIWIIVIRALISWVSPDPYNPIVRFLYRVTEPVLRPVRRILPISGMGIDFSPLIMILIIYVLRIFLVKALIQLSFQFG